MSSLPRSFLLEVAVLLGIIAPAWAADGTVTLRLYAESMLTLESPFETVMVGDPNIVGVHARSDRLQLGETNLVFLDKRNITIATVRIVVSAAVPTNYTPKLQTRSTRSFQMRELLGSGEH